jgi:radical SAM modification target selenobiotic family peptide
MENDTLKRFLSGLCIVSLLAGAALSISGCTDARKGAGDSQSSGSS